MVSRVFDRRALRRQRDRAAARIGEHDFLFDEVAARLVERLDDVRRDFAVALDLGCHGGNLGRRLAGRVATVVQCDLSPAMAARGGGLGVAADEEALPFRENSFDLVASALALHWVNDLPGALIQIARCLRPDGLLLAAFCGGGTLKELRQAWLEAEAAQAGGASPRVAPFAELRDAGALLQRAGLAMPVADAETITATYADPLALMRELRGMGEANALHARTRHFTPRGVAFAAAEAYAARHAGADGRVPARFEILTLTAWKPDPSQPRALKPGAATTRLADALGAEEHPADDR